MLHDVGKVAIPNALLNKPGPLNDAEWEIMRTHTVEGQRMLDRVGGFMRDVGAIVRGSHERWDGGGYPDGLAAEAIPLEARIIAACDAYNAMTTTRPYRTAMDPAAAADELRRCSGSQFDPKVVEALLVVVGIAAPARLHLAA
jgi:HD-GYP domain-containing protein (c-di-GMP phosphodiesterase class II)